MGGVALGQGGDEVVHVGSARGLLDLDVGGLGTAEADIFGEGGVEQHGHLRDDGDALAQGVLVERSQVRAGERHAAGDRVVEARDERDEGGFAGAAGADEGDGLARGDAQGQILERGGGADSGGGGAPRADVVGEAHRFKRDFEGSGGQGRGRDGLRHGVLGVENVFEAFKGGLAVFEDVVDGAEFLDRFVTEVEGGGERGEASVSHAVAGAKVDGGDEAADRYKLDDGRGHRLIFHRFHRELENLADALGESHALAVLKIVSLDLEGGLKGLDRDGCEVAVAGGDLARAFHQITRDVADGQHAERHAEHGDEGEEHAALVQAEHEQRAHGEEQGEGLADDFAADFDHDHLELVGVAHQAGVEVAGLVFAVKGEGQGEQAGVGLDAQTLEHHEAGLVDEVAVGKGGQTAQRENEGKADAGRDEQGAHVVLAEGPFGVVHHPGVHLAGLVEEDGQQVVHRQRQTGAGADRVNESGGETSRDVPARRFEVVQVTAIASETGGKGGRSGVGHGNRLWTDGGRSCCFAGTAWEGNC